VASTQTQEEVRTEYIAAMGVELGQLQYLLWHDVTSLHLKWVEFRELFATRATRIDLMNETAPAFFSRLEDVLWSDVLLHLSRLTDRPVIAGRQNLTLLRYPPLVESLPIKDSIRAGLHRVEAATRFARDWRNRRLAHRDYHHAQNPAASPLEEGSRASVEEALEAIRDLMQVPESYFRDTKIGYQHVVQAAGGAWDLLYHLESGLEAKRSRNALDHNWRPKYL
jgi:hypothetical protein